MIFEFYQNFELSHFCLIFPFIELNWLIILPLSTTLLLPILILVFLGSTSDLVLLVVFNIEVSGAII